jgi:hypothetical protein
MSSPFLPATKSAPSLPVCLLTLPAMPSLSDCFACVSVDLDKYVLYSSALSLRARWRTSLAMLLGGAGELSFRMDDVANDGKLAARPDVPVPAEAEGQGSGADMAAFNNQ